MARKIRNILMVGALLLAGISASIPAHTSAVTDNYPHKDAVCTRSGDPNYGKLNGTCGNYDWGYFTYDPQGNINGSNVNSSRGYGYRNCTDWVAWRLAEAGVGTVPRGWGDGGDWDNAALAASYTVDNTPEAGDIAVWDGGMYGHVEVVESVNANGTVNTSGYNKATTGIYNTQSNVTANHYIDINGSGNGIPGSTVSSPTSAVIGDFTGDKKTDYVVFRPSNGTWYIRGGQVVPWGLAGDIPAPGDYNGDGKVDPTVYRPSEQMWYTHSPGVYSAVNYWGLPGDIPVPGDYAGDRITDRAVYRPSDSTWHVLGGAVTQWGLPGDIPVPADYDGNGTTDYAVFRPSNGTWYIKDIGVTQWGQSGDIPVPGDYDGNGNTDLGVFRPSNGTWYAHRTGVYTAVTPWGTTGDIPMPGKYGGNTYTDYGIFRPSDQMWHVNGSVYETAQWGLPGDIPASQTLNAELLKRYGLIQSY